METTTSSETETGIIAARLAEHLRPGDVVALRGTLGAGKSVFARALIRTLCNDLQLEVPSPTFTLAQTYEADLGTVWHFDLYRLLDADDVFEVGWEEARAGGIVLVEWPERIEALLPASRWEVDLTGTLNTRRIVISARDGRAFTL